jgi:predicted nuclease of restriction endonuclease-like RecB superfamily
MMKFHQLVADVLTTPKGLEIEISGSLDIFGVSQASFGRSVAKFLGYVTKLKRWKLQAEISLKGKSLSFVVDQKTQLISDHSVSLEYVPEEVSHFIDQMQSMLPEWQIISAPEVLNLGAQVYCIPDFSLKGPDGRFHHIELFHRFHQGQLRSRVERWIENPIRQLVLGVSTKVTRDAALTALLDKAKNMGLRSFEFRDFPSARAAMPLIVGESAG